MDTAREFVLAAFFVAVFATVAAAIPATDVPAAVERPAPPVLDRWVTDHAGILGLDHKARLRGELEDFEKTTGIRCYLVTVDSLAKYQADRRQADYLAKQIFDREAAAGGRAMGPATRDFLILIASRDRVGRVRFAESLDLDRARAAKQHIMVDLPLDMAHAPAGDATVRAVEASLLLLQPRPWYRTQPFLVGLVASLLITLPFFFSRSSAEGLGRIGRLTAALCIGPILFVIPGILAWQYQWMGGFYLWLAVLLMANEYLIWKTGARRRDWSILELTLRVVILFLRRR